MIGAFRSSLWLSQNLPITDNHSEDRNAPIINTTVTLSPDEDQQH